MATSPRETGDPLEPVLRDVEAEFERRLHEACAAEAGGIANESTTEIRRLEDALLAAAVAAEQTIALRRHMDRSSIRPEGRSSAPESAPGVPNESAEFVPMVREFRDASGQSWRAWPVTPGQVRKGRTAERYLGEFHKGWICFEALEGAARRRLPSQPAHWTELPDAELVRLLDQAISAPQRKSREPTETPPSLHS